MSSTRTFETEKLAEFIAQLFTATGVYAYDATDCATRILEAEILGETKHGLASLGRHVEAASNGDIDPRAMVMTESETVAVAFLNGNQGMGHAAGTKAANMAVEKAKAVGTGTIVISNSQDFGSPAVYARLIALQGCVGYVTTSTGEKPTFTETLGRHEFAWGIPSDSEACCLLKGASEKDSDTGLATMTAISVANSVVTGALADGRLPVHKTRGVSVERTEHYVHAIDPNQFGGIEKFQKRLGDGLEAIKLDESVLRKAGSDLATTISVSDEAFDELSELGKKYTTQLPG